MENDYARKHHKHNRLKHSEMAAVQNACDFPFAHRPMTATAPLPLHNRLLRLVVVQRHAFGRFPRRTFRLRHALRPFNGHRRGGNAAASGGKVRGEQRGGSVDFLEDAVASVVPAVRLLPRAKHIRIGRLGHLTLTGAMAHQRGLGLELKKGLKKYKIFGTKIAIFRYHQKYILQITVVTHIVLYKSYLFLLDRTKLLILLFLLPFEMLQHVYTFSEKKEIG